MAKKKIKWTVAKEHIEAFAEGCDAGDFITAVKQKSGDWLVISSSGSHVTVGEDADLKTAICEEKED